MITNQEFATLYSRELNKLVNEVKAYGAEDDMWIVLPGTINSGGSLVQHLIGNLRTYIGLTLGKTPYVRDRDAEFTKRLFTKDHLISELQLLDSIINATLNGLSEQDLRNEYPHHVLSLFPEQTVKMILLHLLNHLGYHLGQINYHRRFVSQSE